MGVAKSSDDNLYGTADDLSEVLIVHFYVESA